jgi:hypothetical protein
VHSDIESTIKFSANWKLSKRLFYVEIWVGFHGCTAMVHSDPANLLKGSAVPSNVRLSVLLILRLVQLQCSFRYLSVEVYNRPDPYLSFSDMISHEQ